MLSNFHQDEIKAFLQLLGCGFMTLKAYSCRIKTNIHFPLQFFHNKKIALKGVGKSEQCTKLQVNHFRLPSAVI